ncbi:Bug family tripartite tricarboxylate transporter substrate binding protein [Roseomonas xinghualingensis]|uniref:Bug family tripartite tricarboxylate transporter substrate binding protein n=1 Tax=Roseomonas xinghualingensis TaxID=2986475 RepID=UPI0021F19C45|nr:tripartite tricarboxylate transporter substrate-binding protein [Roseomonas sp. SXEYE001]MCV4207495.1 tripartite tricarboxylate transporter substrate-binding protein [Roseomonas sp. SXEYE001]
MRRRSLLALPGLAMPFLANGAAWGQGWKPPAPLRYVVPFPPGSSFDMVARIVTDGAAPRLGQNIVVENRPGAGTLVAVQAVKVMPPDGQTVVMVANSFTVNPTLHKPKPYDPLMDFDPLALLVEMPHVMVCHPDVARDFAAFVAKARQPGAGLSFGSNGQGTSQHMGMEQFKLLAGLNAQHVPYRGTPPMMTDLYAARLDYTLANLPDVLPGIHDNRLVPLGIVARQRHKLLPDVPTFAELGFGQMVSDSWYGLVMPAGAKPEVRAALTDAVIGSLARPEARARLEENGLDILAKGPAELTERIKRDTAVYAEVVRAANLTPG